MGKIIVNYQKVKMKYILKKVWLNKMFKKILIIFFNEQMFGLKKRVKNVTKYIFKKCVLSHAVRDK